MRIDRLALADSKVPRYTSYPTAAQFTPAVGAIETADWLAAVDPDRPISLYVHIPFCRQLCWYCGCNTSVTRRTAPIARYLATLRREVEMVARLLPGRMQVSHLHFGGGTPSILGAEDFRGLAALLREHFAFRPEAEVAIELDPRGLDATRIAALAGSGVTRVSLGIQDLDPDVQSAINRIQPLDLVSRQVAALRDAGLGRISMDLIYGLPRQTTDTIRRTVEAVAGLVPDRVSLFGYAHVPWMKSHQRLLEPAGLPGAAARLALCDAATAALGDAGYESVGIDHFARPDDDLARAARVGRMRRNFQGYTTDDAACLIGFGASAIGSFAQGLVQNATRTDDWSAAIDGGRLSTSRGVRVDATDRRRARIIERLMCDFAVDLAQDIARDPAIRDILGGIEDLARLGIARVDGTRLAVPSDARPFARIVAARFDRYLAPAATRHAAAV